MSPPPPVPMVPAPPPVALVCPTTPSLAEQAAAVTIAAPKISPSFKNAFIACSPSPSWECMAGARESLTTFSILFRLADRASHAVGGRALGKA